MEKIINERNLLMHSKEELIRRIRDLGSLPADAFEKYQHLSQKELARELSNTNKKLAKFRFVPAALLC